MKSILEMLDEFEKISVLNFTYNFKKELIQINNGKHPNKVLNRAQKRKAYRFGVIQGQPRGPSPDIRIPEEVLTILGIKKRK